MTDAPPAARPLLLSRMPSGEPEIFSSIQGEGISAGNPSTFVRLAVCNLRCSWCDTAYTWDWRQHNRAEQVLPSAVDPVLERIHSFPARNVVITGGEPLIQRAALLPLVEALKRDGYNIEVETNGTIAPGPLAALIDQWNVSAKLAHSGNEGLATIRPDVLRAFAGLPSAWFKFVVAEPADLTAVVCLAQEHSLRADRIVLMPLGRTRAELESRSTWLAEACAANGYRFSSRLHILLWGDKRGV